MAESNVLQAFLAAGETPVSNLLLHHYHDIHMTTGELMVYLELKSYIDRGEANPAIDRVAAHLGTSEHQVYELLHQLTHKGLVVQRLHRQADGKEEAYYDFAPLYERLAQVVGPGATEPARPVKTAVDARQDLFAALQVEFGRPLSPIEMQTVNQWLDQDHTPVAMVKLALREAVLTGHYNFKYIEGILRRWRQAHLTTPEQVEADQRRFEAQQEQRGTSNGSGKPPVKIDIFKLGPEK